MHSSIYPYSLLQESRHGRDPLQPAMGQYKHHRHSWQLRIWEDVSVPRNNQDVKPAMGGSSVHGMHRALIWLTWLHVRTA